MNRGLRDINGVGVLTGLIYGIGHAIYSISDPRERLLRLIPADGLI